MLQVKNGKILEREVQMNAKFFNLMLYGIENVFLRP